MYIDELDEIVDKFRKNGCVESVNVIDYNDMNDLEDMMEDNVANILRGCAREGRTSAVITFEHIDNDVFLGIIHHAVDEWEIFAELYNEEMRDFIDRSSEKTAKIKFYWSAKE